MASTGNRSAISVICRLKPTDMSAVDIGDMKIDEKESIIEVRNKRRAEYVTPSVDNTVDYLRFNVNGLLVKASQERVYDACCKDIVESALSGVSGALFAYGQTGAGKTYTMVGPPGNYTERGIVPRAIAHVFEAAERARTEDGQDRYVIRVSYLEIYQDRLIDLLANSMDLMGAGADTADIAKAGPSTTPSTSALHIAEDPKGRVYVKGLSCPVVKTAPEAFNWFFAGEANRAIAEHALNKASTRSHCVFTVYLEQQMAVEQKAARTASSLSEMTTASDAAEGTPPAIPRVTVASKLHLVDLAGSERLEKSESEGVMRKEAQAINKSLSFLEQVVLAITEKRRDHIPYRSSKLTHFLKDSFTHGRTRMIAAVWPGLEYLDETVSTLRFAMRMMHIKTVAQRDIVQSGMSDAEKARIVATYEKEIALLRAELAFKDALNGSNSTATYAPLSVEHEASIVEKAAYLVNDDTSDVSTVPFDSVREAYSLMRALVSLARKFKATATAGQPLAATSSSKAALQIDLPGANLQISASVPLPEAKDAAMESSNPAMPSETETTVNDAADASGGKEGSSSALSSEIAAVVVDTRPLRTDEVARDAELNLWRTTGKGTVLYTDYQQAKQSIKDSKQKYADCAAELNSIKKVLDELIASVKVPGGDSEEALEKLLNEKKRYRSRFDELNERKSEIEYLQTVSDQLAQKIAREFQEHWKSVSREPDVRVNTTISAAAPTAGSAMSTQSPTVGLEEVLQHAYEAAAHQSAGKLKPTKSLQRQPFALSPGR